MESLSEASQSSTYETLPLRVSKEQDDSQREACLSRQNGNSNVGDDGTCTPDSNTVEGDLERAIYARLIGSPYREVRHARAVISGESVVLLGNVSTYFVKQMAQEAIRGFTGHLRIDNQLNVTESTAQIFKPR